jgi:hypothetical protein
MKNKLTEEDILNTIISEESVKLGEKTTVVLLKLKNGFEVVGKSGCVDPANYNHEIGVGVARKRAIDQIWFLEGYLLQESLYKQVMATEAHS